MCEAIKDYTPLKLIMKDRAEIDQRQNDELRPIFKGLFQTLPADFIDAILASPAHLCIR